MDRAPGHFDPWTATQPEALRAATVDPQALAQHQAARAVLHAQDECLGPVGGCAVLKALNVCLAAGLMPPQWLSDQFIALYARVGDADVGSWDAAFGVPFPPRTRLHEVRENRRLRRVVHAAVFQAVVEQGRAVDRQLFDDVGRQPDVCRSGSTCEKRYYEALGEGMPNPLEVHAQMERTARAAPLSHVFSSWRRIDQSNCESGASAQIDVTT